MQSQPLFLSWRRSLLTLVALVVVTATGHRVASPAPADDPRPGWKLVWQDCFSGDGLDLAEWEQIRRKDSQNNEKQYYLPEQIKVVDGLLRITATNEPLDGKLFRSGRLRTYRQWSLGRFEARIRLPRTQGMWPAFWLLPRDVKWPEGGEVDIMEAGGSTPQLTSSAYHWGTSWKTHRYLSRRQKFPAAVNDGETGPDAFHVYACEWNEDEIRFFVDGKEHFVVSSDYAPIHTTQKAIVLNLAVGGFYDGDPDETTQFPQQMDVDYVKVWQRADTSE